MNIGFQLWSVHQLLDTEENMELIIKAIKESGYQGVELFNISDDQLFKQVIRLLNKYDLSIFSAHCAYEQLDQNLEQTIERYKQLNVESLVVPIAFEITKSVSNMKTIIYRLVAIRQICLKHNIELYYHNHDCECLMLDNDYIINHVGRNGIALEYDVHWLVRGGLDPYQMVSTKYPSSQIHIKDLKMINDGGQFKLVDCVVGKGTLDLDRLVKVANDRQIKWLIVEQEYNSQFIEEQIKDIKNSFIALNEKRRIYES